MTDWTSLEKALSAPRLGRYLQAYKDDKEKAHQGYVHNLQLCESLLASLSVLEIALRNAMSNQMAKLYGQENWYDSILTDTSLHLPGKPPKHDKALRNLRNSIESARKGASIPSKGPGDPNPNKVIAEFSFGFWTTLLNARYQRDRKSVV